MAKEKDAKTIIEDRWRKGKAVPYVETGITRKQFVAKYGEEIAKDYAFNQGIARYKPPGSVAISG